MSSLGQNKHYLHRFGKNHCLKVPSLIHLERNILQLKPELLNFFYSSTISRKSELILDHPVTFPHFLFRLIIRWFWWSWCLALAANPESSDSSRTESGLERSRNEKKRNNSQNWKLVGVSGKKCQEWSPRTPTSPTTSSNPSRGKSPRRSKSFPARLKSRPVRSSKRAAGSGSFAGASRATTSATYRVSWSSTRSCCTACTPGSRPSTARTPWPSCLGDSSTPRRTKSARISTSKSD